MPLKKIFLSVYKRLNNSAWTWLLYILCGAFILSGQGFILGQKITAGLIFTAIGVLFYLVSLAGEERLQKEYKSFRLVINAWILRLESVAAKWSRKDLPFPAAKTPQEGAESVGAKQPGDKPVEKLPLPTFKDPIILSIPKKIILILGGGLLITSQPLFFMEKLGWGLGLLALSIPMLFYLIVSKQPALVLGRLDSVLKAALLALPGVAAVILGDRLMLKNMELSFTKEIIGYFLNFAGILLLIALLPKTAPDNDPRPFLDRWTGETRSGWGKTVKALLVAGAVVFFVLANRTGDFKLVTVLVLLGIAAAVLSFPWKAEKTGTAEPGLVRLISGRLLRLAAFGLALYLGYRGQTLISHEQLYPGLYRFAAAALALIIAFREPDPKKPDTFQEPPLKWYWEALGVILIMAAAIWVRTRLLDIMPYGVECDEAGAGYHAVDIWKNNFQSITVHPSGRPLFMLLSKVVAFQFFDIGNVGMRFMAMVWGVASVLAVYLLARLLYGPRVALATAALLAFSRWHIHFSRFGWSNTLMILLQMIGFYFLIKGYQLRKKWYFVLAGASLALSVQTETAARIVPVICLGMFVLFTLNEKRWFRRDWKLVLAFVLGIWLTGASIVMFWINKPQLLARRVYEVSLFADDANAPRDIWRGLVHSTKYSITQLNWHGDYRTRHNGGLSGEPVLDFWTAILFALGFVITVYYWRRFRYGLLLMWFFGFMAASVLSLEAPQSHRAFGAIPAVFLMIGAFLDRSRRLLKESLGRPGVWLGVLMFCLLFYPIAKTNFNKYFDAFPGFDTACTAAARHMGGGKWKDAHHFIMSAHLWMGHPPFMLYSRGIDAQFYYQPSEVVPIRRAAEQDALYTFILEYQPLIPIMQWYYPNGQYEDEIHEKWGQQFQSWGVKHEEIMRTRGLTASYWNNTTWSGPPVLTRQDANLDLAFSSENWPLDGAGSIAWEGTVFVPHAGEYGLYAFGSDYFEVRVGRQAFLRAENKQEDQRRVWLAGGLHRLRARAKVLSPDSRVLLAWQCDQTVPYFLHHDPYQKRFFKQAIPTTHLFTYPEPIGLLESLYDNGNWQGRPVRQTVEPVPFFYWHGMPHGFTPPLSADWRGRIKIDRAGDYCFEIQHGGFVELEIDGRTIIRAGTVPDGQNRGTTPRNPIHLEPGEYPLLMRWSATGGWFMKFWWKPPGGERELVPAWILSPEAE